MAKEPKRIKVGADVALALREAERDGTPIEIEANGATYRVATMRPATARDSLWSGYDPEKVRAAVAKYAGSWSDVDADNMIAALYRAREEGSRPADRP